MLRTISVPIPTACFDPDCEFTIDWVNQTEIDGFYAPIKYLNGRDVDVIDAGFGDQFECRVGASLAHSPERRCAEDHARTRMAGAPERQGREVGHDAPRRVRMA